MQTSVADQCTSSAIAREPAAPAMLLSDLVPRLGSSGARSATRVEGLNQPPQLGLDHRILVPSHS